MTTVLLVDDHELFRIGLRLALNQEFPELHVAEATCVADALRTLRESPEVIVLDVTLLGLNGVDSIEMFLKRWPSARILMLSSVTDPAVAEESVRRGASAFLSKGQNVESILQVIQRYLGFRTRRHTLSPSPEKLQSVSDNDLSLRQKQVLDLLCQGLSNKAIARRLFLSENTVRGHVQGILSNLNVASRLEAVYEARRRGLVG